MIKKILALLLIGVSCMMAQIKSVDEKQLQEMISNGIVVVDIRREDEFKHYGIIEGAKTITFFDERGGYDPHAWLSELEKYVKDKDQTFVIYCAHANRTKVIGDFLQSQVGYKNVYELAGGINYGWLDKGMKTVRY
jgi:rhodanese-related sulfurtransferase